MKRLFQVMVISAFTLGSVSALASDAQRSVAGNNKPAKIERNHKSNKRKNQPSKMDQEILAESRAEGGSLSSQEEIDEIRQSLGEK